MRENKIHLKGHNFRYHNACGTNRENTVEFEEFEFYTPKEKRCENCLATNEYKNMLAEHESKRPLDKGEFEEPERSQLEIDAKKYKLGGELFGAFEKNELHIDTSKISLIFDENNNIIWVKPPKYNPQDVAFKKVDNYENTPEKYKLTIKNRNGESVVCDVYDIIESIGYLNTPHFQGLKKALCPGIRGEKDVEQDLNEAIQCFEIAKLMIKKE